MFRREKSLKGTGSVAQKIYITLQEHLSAKPTIFDLMIYDFLGATKAILSTEDTKGFLTQFHPSNTEHTRSYKIAACIDTNEIKINNHSDSKLITAGEYREAGITLNGAS